MALPTGITTCVVTAGAPLDFAGQGGTITLTVTPILGGNATNIVWQATGQPLVNFPMTATADATEQAQVVIPHSDQAGFVNGAGDAFSGWSYKAQIVFKGANRQQVAWTKVFQIPSGQAQIDLDLVPDGSITSPTTAPIEPVTSVNGQTGAVTVEGATDAGVAGYVTGGGETEAALTHTIAKKVPADALIAWGHSYMKGNWAGGYGTLGQTMAPTMGATLGLPLRNMAVAGSQLCDNNRGWAPVLQTIARTEAGSGKAGNRFTPHGGLHVLMHGLNDLSGNGHQAVLPKFEAVLRAVISRWRAAAIFENTDASVTLAGAAWNSFAGTDRNSGVGVQYTTVNGATITVNTPADFPGGTIALGFTVYRGDTATITSQPINGQTYSVDMGAIADTTFNICSVMRIPDLPAGSASYTFTVSNATGSLGCCFDYWQWEAPSGAGALVALIKQPLLVDYSVQADPIADADVTALNAVIDSVAAEFGPHVVTVDTSSLDHDARAFVTGNVHPTPYGHRRIAELVSDALADLVRYQPAPSPRQPRVEYGTAAPTSTFGPYYYAGDRVLNSGATEQGAAGAKYVTEGWLCTAEGQPGTWVPLNTLTGAPSSGGGSGWVAYTPTFGGVTLGDGTVVGGWRDAGNSTVDWYAKLTLGAATTVDSTVTVTMPAGMATAFSRVAETARAMDSGSGYYTLATRTTVTGDATTPAQVTLVTIGTNGKNASVNGTTPITWAAGDVIEVSGRFRKA